jgi:opacity protein-like surface antigen
MGTKLVAGLLWAGVCLAQQWEIGGAAGYGFYRDVRVNGAGAEATVGIRNRFVASAVVTENLYNHFSGEVRYTYQDGDPFVSFNGVRANIQGQSHSLTYDVLFHARGREARLRPYAAAGMGGKFYRTTGPAPGVQPAPNIVLLVPENQWQFVFSVGGGLSYVIGRHVILRADFRDYITPFPTDLFKAVNHATDRGLFQQFTPMLGISIGF